MTTYTYESAYAYLTQPNFYGGMEPYDDFLRLFVALLANEVGVPGEHLLAELAYHLNDDQRRALQQLAAAANRLDDAAINAEVSVEQYEAQKSPRFGVSNPEQMDVPFWRFMVRRHWIAFRARMQFNAAYRAYVDAYCALKQRREAGEDVPDEPDLPHPGYGSPVWCFSRFGMSLTRLPDGRAVFIAGEHEDFYDPDFHIYNDVIVIDSELRVTIYGYPEHVFPPTDFHTATRVGEHEIYLIGNLGYPKARRPGETPVYRLDTETMQISAVTTGGSPPGWISSHDAIYNAEQHAITISGGQIVTEQPEGARLQSNAHRYRLDLHTLEWMQIGGE